MMPWRPIPLSYGVAIYPFQPGGSSAELPLQIGDQLYVIEQGGANGGWYRGYLVAPPSLLSTLTTDHHGGFVADTRVFSGIFPKSCVEVREELARGVSRPGSRASSKAVADKPPAPVPMLKIGDETTLSPEPLVDEISSCLREWYLLQLPSLVLERQYDLLHRVNEIVTKLEYARRQLLNDVLTEFEKTGLREEAVMNLVRVSKMLSGEIIVRDHTGRLLTGDDSAVEMSKSTIAGVLQDIFDDEQTSSARVVNGHVDSEDGRASALGRSGTVISRQSHLSRRLSKVTINQNEFSGGALTSAQENSEESSDRVLYLLRRWKQLPSVELLSLLPKVQFVSEHEVVNHLEAIFDALFSILVHKAGENQYEDVIFNDMVRLLSIINDRRFDVRNIVDQYLEEQFDHPLAAPCLLRSLTRLLHSVTDPQSARDLRAFFKIGQYLIRIIVVSHQQSKINAISVNLLANHKSFKEDVQSILFGLQMMMRSETPSLIGSKTLLVQHFHSWLPALLPVFTTDEVMRMAINFVDSCQDAKGKLLLHRLLLIRNYAKLGELWFGASERTTLVKNCLRWLSPYWIPQQGVSGAWREQIRLCCGVIAELLRHPSPSLYDFLIKITATYRVILAADVPRDRHLCYLFPETYPFPSKSVTTADQGNEPLLEMGALISDICKTSPPLAVNLQDGSLNTLVSALLACQESVLDGDAYPITWLSLVTHCHKSTLTVLQYVYQLLTKCFLPAPEFADEFDMDLWKTYLDLLLKLVTSDALALERFSEQKRRAVWKIGGDIRESGARLLRSSWESIGWEASADDERRYELKRLGGYQVQYVPGIIPSIMCLCLSMHEGLRRVAVEILQTMIVSEWALSEDLILIETEMVSSLDHLFKERVQVNEATDKLFITELRDRFSTIAGQPDDALWTTLDELLTALDDLVSLLSARSTASTATDEAANTLALTEFMASMSNRDLFVRYIHQLAHSYDTATPPQPLFAAQALARHAAIYSWIEPETNGGTKIPETTTATNPSSSTLLPSIPLLSHNDMPSLAESTGHARKETLYLAMISRYEDARAWSDAMRVLQGAR